MTSLQPLTLQLGRNLDKSQKARMAPCVEVDGLFTPDECRRIIARRDALGFDQAPIPVREGHGEVTRGHTVDRSVRVTERTHILPSAEDQWIFDRLARAVSACNAQAWQFRVAYMEPIQMLAYPTGGHFEWHSDLGDRGVSSLRKVSATILLSHPSDYEGGELQFITGGKELTPKQGHGKGIFFPAFQQHRVLEVTRGTRHVLILWTLGKRSLR